VKTASNRGTSFSTASRPPSSRSTRTRTFTTFRPNSRAALTAIEKLAYLCNIGTLFAFFLVCVGVLVLRFTHPTLPRPFRCPWGKTVSGAGALVSLGLMLSMPAGSWWRLGLWLLAGLILYFLYAWRSGRFKAGEIE
jgi:APA family basic amino acid/polyamine antiporter